jgi:hypothetical protein
MKLKGMKIKMENVQKCEFLLTLGENIVCQRYFTVRNFNNNATNSLDLHWAISNISDDMETRLKYKTSILLDSYYKEIVSDSVREEEYFTITIKKGSNTIYSRIIYAEVYPPKVRYTVDIRPQISQILRELTDVLSDKDVTTNYQDYNLLMRG